MSDSNESTQATSSSSVQHARRKGGNAHIDGVSATPGGLIRATVGSAAAAGAILVFAWLPAEYGLDPTGVGGWLGLTEMGEIKQQLYDEAAEEEAANATDSDVASRLEEIETQVAAIARALDASTGGETDPAQTESAEGNAEGPADSDSANAGDEESSGWRDKASHTLAPDEGVEIKLAMEEGDTAEFEWTANGAELNHDMHGSGSGQSTTYERGRGVPGQEGELVAEFTGKHGWFWRNRTDEPVTFTLRTKGEYSEIVKP